MVQITPLLFAITVLSQFALSLSTSNGLFARQSINTNSLPSACQSPCNVINTMSSCSGDESCLCTSSIGSELEQCMNCLVSANPAATDDANGSISAWNLACNGDLSLSGGSGSGSSTSTSAPGASPSGNSPNSLGSNGSVGLKAGSTVVCIFSALVGAYIYL